MLVFAFTSYFCKIGSIDKYFTILSHLVQITVKYDIILLYTLHYIRLKFSKKPDTGSWGRTNHVIFNSDNITKTIDD